jgi:hypothetical protein
MYRIYKHNIEALSAYHCSRGKAITITHSECVCGLSYPGRKPHAPYYIVTCGLSGCSLFFPQYLIHGNIFKDFFKNKICVLTFSSTFV